MGLRIDFQNMLADGTKWDRMRALSLPPCRLMVGRLNVWKDEARLTGLLHNDFC